MAFIDIHHAVNFRRLSGGSPFQQQFRFGGFAVNQDSLRRADQLLIFLQRNARLHLHKLLAPLRRDFRRNLVRQIVRRGPVFRRIGEHAHAVELRVAREIFQFAERGVGFARKADNQRRAQRQAGNVPAQVVNQSAGLRFGNAAPHLLQNRVVNMLQRQIEIRADFFGFRHQAHQRAVKIRRIRVHQAQPAHRLDGDQAFQKRRDLR